MICFNVNALSVTYTHLCFLSLTVSFPPYLNTLAPQ